MPLILWQVYAWIGGAGTFIFPLLKKVPWQVWAAIGGVVAVLWYGHIRENRGYAKCQAQVKIATDHEVARQTEVSQNAIAASQRRAVEAATREQEAKNNADKLQQEVDQLKNAKIICLPDSITRKYRR